MGLHIVIRDNGFGKGFVYNILYIILLQWHLWNCCIIFYANQFALLFSSCKLLRCSWNKL